MLPVFLKIVESRGHRSWEIVTFDVNLFTAAVIIYFIVSVLQKVVRVDTDVLSVGNSIFKLLEKYIKWILN